MKTEIFVLPLLTFSCYPPSLLRCMHAYLLGLIFLKARGFFFQMALSLEKGLIHRLLITGLLQVQLDSSHSPHLAFPEHWIF